MLAGASPADLGRSLAYAAALRVARFGTRPSMPTGDDPPSPMKRIGANDSEQSGGLDAALECFTGRWRSTPPAISTYRRKPAPCRSSACASVPMSAAGGWPSVRWRAPSGRLDVPSAIGCALNKAARISSIVLGTLSNRSPPSPGSRAGALPDDIKGEEDCSRRERMLVEPANAETGIVPRSSRAPASRQNRSPRTVAERTTHSGRTATSETGRNRSR